MINIESQKRRPKSQGSKSKPKSDSTYNRQSFFFENRRTKPQKSKSRSKIFRFFLIMVIVLQFAKNGKFTFFFF